jgi:hypothetical protein
MSLDNKETLQKKKKPTKQKERQVANIEILTKIIPIIATCIVLVEKKFLLNKRSTNCKETNRKTYIMTFDFTSNMLFFFFWMN